MDVYEKKNLLKYRRNCRGYKGLVGSAKYRRLVGQYGILIKVDALAMLLGITVDDLYELHNRKLIPKPIPVMGGSYRIDVAYSILVALWLSLVPIKQKTFTIDEELFVWLLTKWGAGYDGDDGKESKGDKNRPVWARV